ncbi:MAG: hypothetical protein EPO11_04610 [Gammaproteobacteria bacterium]|nr:MAG: hypothetical protein EPO11_04610 [Gammaproteobacteria bacterium]
MAYKNLAFYGASSILTSSSLAQPSFPSEPPFYQVLSQRSIPLTFSLFSKPLLIGLAIQHDAVRWVQLKKAKQAFLIEQAHSSPLPLGVVAEGKIKRVDALRSVLTDLVYRHRLEGRMAAISLPAHLVRMQRIQLPAGLSESEIEAEMNAHLQNELPGLSEALCMDFTVLPASRPGQDIDVFFAAARREDVEQYVECVQAVGVKVKIVDVDTYALKRAVCLLAGGEVRVGEVNAILHFAAHAATLIVFKAEEILFQQQWEVTEAVDFLLPLKQALQLFLPVQQLIVCGTNAPLHDVTSLGIASIHRPPLAAPEFLLAYGLAMREVPRW